ncbi:hypothetical protein Pmani_037435 [Petrolisthes manimaculis]|uniref:Uncharacterized protein n=1 Tax=Petrolisthes manimaculis TaxID=1843537 RepID=A0AAE1NHR9_9EUCA|nr:hypothetical protein Pmani_037435 [Petrolisthes manimaculis]
MQVGCLVGSDVYEGGQQVGTDTQVVGEVLEATSGTGKPSGEEEEKRCNEGTSEDSGGGKESTPRSQGEGKGKDKGAARGGDGGGSVLTSFTSDIHCEWRFGLQITLSSLQKCQAFSRLDTALEGSRTL